VSADAGCPLEKPWRNASAAGLSRLCPLHGDGRTSSCHGRGDDGATRRLGIFAGVQERSVYNIDEAASARFYADGGDGGGDGSFETGPFLAAEDSEVAGRFIPFKDEAGVGSGACGVARVAAEELLGDVQPATGRIDLCAFEALPEVAQCK
jgi:hypothetical protein